MTHYSDHSGHVKITFFKPSGKYYMEEVLDMSKFWKSGPNNLTPIDAVENSMKDNERHKGLLETGYFTVVVLDPYHELAYPVCIPSKKLVETP